MGLLEAIGFLVIGAGFGIAVVAILQKERIVTAVGYLKRLGQSLLACQEQRAILLRQISAVKSEVQELQRSIVRLRNERDAIEIAWQHVELSLQSTNRVLVDEAIVFGRGVEWVYLYTFPAHEKLASARQEKYYPMKLGMSAQSSVVDRVHQQVSGNSTAISERAVIRLVFRANSSRDVESWMHAFLKKNGRQLPGSVGVEWFNTNPVEIEQLFRSYVLQQPRVFAYSKRPSLAKRRWGFR